MTWHTFDSAARETPTLEVVQMEEAPRMECEARAAEEVSSPFPYPGGWMPRQRHPRDLAGRQIPRPPMVWREECPLRVECRAKAVEGVANSPPCPRGRILLQRRLLDPAEQETPMPGSRREAGRPMRDRPIRRGREWWTRRRQSRHSERFREWANNLLKCPTWTRRRCFRHPSLGASGRPNQSRRCSWTKPSLPGR